MKQKQATLKFAVGQRVALNGACLAGKDGALGTITKRSRLYVHVKLDDAVRSYAFNPNAIKGAE